jgi:hypothetical protein
MSTKSKNAVVTAASVAVVGSALLPAFVRARTTPAMNACVNSLRQLDGAKQQWELENHKSTNDVPTMGDLQPYLVRPLVCPQGGTYTPGRVGELPRCSVGGLHKLPQ